MRFDRTAWHPINVSQLIVRTGRWTLITAVLCFALIGFLHVTRGTAVRHVQGVGADGVPIGVSEPQFPLSVTLLTGAWMAPGNRVDVALNGDGRTRVCGRTCGQRDSPSRSSCITATPDGWPTRCARSW